MFDLPTEFQFFSTLALMGTAVTFMAFLLFFFRVWYFYKKGVVYASKNERLPKFSDIHLVFFVIGILAPIVVCFIPFLGMAVLVIEFIAFIKIIPDILKLNHPSRIKPEKMIFIGVGLGFGGLFGFLLGFFRGSSYKDETTNET